MADPLELVGLLACETRFLMQEHFPGIPTCVLSTAICRDVLEYFEVPSEPVAVAVVIGNRAWAEWQQANDWMGAPPLPDGAYALGVQPYAEALPGRWNGHLVLQAADGLLDTDVGYWNRPEHGIILPQGSFFVDGMGTYQNRDGSVVIYRPLPGDDGSWRTRPDWVDQKRRKPFVGRLIRMCKELG